jgi:PAS domain S-box-containing protein
LEQSSFSFVDSFVASAAFSAVLFGALGFAWRTYRQRYLGYWTVYWGLYTLVWPGLALLETRRGSVQSDSLLFALDVSATLAGFAARAALALGVLDYLGRPPLRRRGLTAVAALVLFLAAASTLAQAAVARGAFPSWIEQPFRSYTLGVLLFPTLAVVVLRDCLGHPHPAPRRLLAAALLAYGLGDLWDLYLAAYSGRSPWFSPDMALRLSALATHAYDALSAVAMMVVAIGAEWQRAEEAARGLRASEARLRSLFENALDVVAVLEPAGTVRFASPSVERVLGYRPPAFVGRDLLDLFHPDDRQRSAAAFREAAAPPCSPSRLEVRIQRPDGGWLWMEIVLQLRELAPGDAALVASLRDVTERRALQERLHQAQRLETIGQLAGGVAHDFNNLLTAVLANLSMMESTLPPGAPEREDLRDATLAADRATRLTRQLLTFARQQLVAPRRVDLNEIVAAMDRMLGRLIGEHIARRARLAPGLWPVRIDPSQLEQVLVNLVVNARDAMPGGGTLSIETGNVVLAPGACDPAAVDVPAGEWVRLDIDDTGHGMDEATLSRIFEPFFTTKEKGRGTGLGLATVHGTVRQAGGHVRVRSAPGAGTRFTVWLPRDRDGAEELPGASPAAARGGDETILLAEDDPQVRSVAVRILASHGYRVLQAADGLEALRVFDDHAGPISLLVTDVVMPELGGRGLAEAVQERRPGLPVLFLSGYPEGGVEPGSAFLPKPFTAEQLAGTVRGLLDGQPKAASVVLPARWGRPPAP